MKRIVLLSLFIGILVLSGILVGAENINPEDLDCLGETAELKEVGFVGENLIVEYSRVLDLESDYIKWKEPKQNLGSFMREIGKWLEEDDKPEFSKKIERFFEQFHGRIDCINNKKNSAEYSIMSEEFKERVILENGIPVENENLAVVRIDKPTYVILKENLAIKWVNDERTSKLPRAENYDVCIGKIKLIGEDDSEESEEGGFLSGLADSISFGKKDSEGENLGDREIKLGQLNYPDKEDTEFKKVSCESFEECGRKFDKAEELACKYNLEASVDFGIGNGRPVCNDIYTLELRGNLGKAILTLKTKMIEVAREEKGVELTIRELGNGAVGISARSLLGNQPIPMTDCIRQFECEEVNQNNFGFSNHCVDVGSVSENKKEYINTGYKCPEGKVCVDYRKNVN
jgi:hypothetical protein